MIGELVAKLIAAGTPPELAAEVVTEAFAAGAVRGHSADIVDVQAERRREKDRERKREIRRHSAESADIPQNSEKVLILTKEDNKKEKKVRATKIPLPQNFQPNEKHFEAAQKLNIPRSAVLAKCEDMRIWAQANGALKVNWDATLHGFLRRDAEKLAAYPTGSPNGATELSDADRDRMFAELRRKNGRMEAQGNHVSGFGDGAHCEKEEGGGQEGNNPPVH